MRSFTGTGTRWKERMILMDKWLENKELPYHFMSACGLVYRDGHVLLVKNPKRGWELPGGTTEQGETIIDTLKREVLEESGIVCEPEHLVGVYQNLLVKEGYGPLEGMKIPPIINLCFTCRYISGEVTASEESEDVCWTTPEEAVKMVEHPLYRERLADALKFCGDVAFSSYTSNDKATNFINKMYL